MKNIVALCTHRTTVVEDPGGSGGSGTPSGVLAAEIYDIFTQGNPSKLCTSVRNFDKKLLDATTYRMVLMRWRRRAKKGYRWATPIYTREDSRGILSDDACWWPITAQFNDPWWNGAKRLDEVLTINSIKTKNSITFFKNNTNRKMRFGCAIFKKVADTGDVYTDWKRVSNIAKAELFLRKKKFDTDLPYIMRFID